MPDEATAERNRVARDTYWVNFHVGEFVSDSTIFLTLCRMRTPLYQRMSECRTKAVRWAQKNTVARDVG